MTAWLWRMGGVVIVYGSVCAERTDAIRLARACSAAWFALGPGFCWLQRLSLLADPTSHEIPGVQAILPLTRWLYAERKASQRIECISHGQVTVNALHPRLIEHSSLSDKYGKRDQTHRAFRAFS